MVAVTILAITLAALLVLGYPAHRWAVRDRMQRTTIRELERDAKNAAYWNRKRELDLIDDRDRIIDDLDYAVKANGWLIAENARLARDLEWSRLSAVVASMPDAETRMAVLGNNVIPLRSAR